jgi:putative heme transporter
MGEDSGPGVRQATWRRVALVAGAVLLMIGVLALLVDRVPGLRRSFAKLDEGDPGWLASAGAFEIASYAGYVVLLRAVFDGQGVRLGWGISRRITLAGVTATRLLSTAGAGGIALTAWALRRAGMAPRSLANRLSAFFVLLYAVFMGALVVGGVGLRVGIWPGPAPFGLTVIPAAFGATVIVTALGFTLVPADLDHRVRRAWPAERRGRRLAARLAVVPATIAAGVREAVRMARSGDPRLAGALAWWGFDILVLWAALTAFGAPPPAAALVMAYFTGQLGNLLPLPGGVGGVEGSMIAALLAFDTPGGLAIAGVLTYRVFAFWLPILPGALAYARLRGELDQAEDHRSAPGGSPVARRVESESQ